MATIIKIKPNMQFGYWTTIERDYHPSSKQHSTFWFCKCGLCGQIYSVSRDSLINKKSHCCNNCKGKIIKEKSLESGRTKYNIQRGEQFGLLTVIGESKNINSKGDRYFECQCQCGNIVNVRLGHLLGLNHSQTISCGCHKKSAGELKIMQILEENQINFQNQYRIKEFNISAPFDFALFDKNNHLLGLIEYDGAQHFNPVNFFGGEEQFKKQVERDEKKNQWCKENQIKLIRINYKDYNKINFDYIKEFFPEI